MQFGAMQTGQIKTARRCLYTAVSLALLGTQAQAQGDRLILEEVVVTAQKAVEFVQDVPVTVNAITGETFERTVNFDLQDVGKLTPGLVMTATGNNQNITLRGIGTNIQAAQSPRTNIYFDGSYVPNQQLSFYSQFDIQRVEVLRGPQGTLYSKTSPTGSILIHTRNPNLYETEGFVRTSIGEHDLFNTQFGVSIPLVEGEMGLRLAGLYDENNSQDQHYETLNKDALSRTNGGRATLVWEPQGPFSGRLSHTYVEVDSNVAQFVGETGAVSRYDRKVFDDTERDQDIRLNQTILELNWDMDWAVLSSQSYYAESTNDDLVDFDSTGVDERTRATSITFTKLFNTELRLASTGNEYWDWIAGLYYADSLASTDVVDKDVILTDFQGFSPVWILADQTTDVNLLTSSEDWGVFTHNTFYLSQDWTLTVGARWSDERRDSVNSTEGTLGLPVPPFQQPFTLPTAVSETRYIDWTGTIKLSYHLTPDQMLYFTVDRGGRSGGQTLDLQGTTPDELQTFDPESSNSVELGYKSDLLGGRMRFNSAIYYQVYKDFHSQFLGVPIRTPQGQLAEFDIIINADEVVSQGAEIDVTYLFTENLRTNLMVSYNDSKYEEFGNAPCDGGNSAALAPGEFATCDLSGQRVGGETGNWSVVANAAYSLPIESIGSEWYLEGLLNFNSFRVAPTSRRQSASYATVDFFTGLRSMDGTWDLKLWVKNAFDKEATIMDDEPERLLADRSLAFQPVMGQPTELPSGMRPQEHVIPPRQVGVTGVYRF